MYLLYLLGLQLKQFYVNYLVKLTIIKDFFPKRSKTNTFMIYFLFKNSF